MKNNIDKASVLACLPACLSSLTLPRVRWTIAKGLPLVQGGRTSTLLCGGWYLKKGGKQERNKGRGRAGKRVQHINLQSNLDQRGEKKKKKKRGEEREGPRTYLFALTTARQPTGASGAWLRLAGPLWMCVRVRARACVCGVGSVVLHGGDGCTT